MIKQTIFTNWTFSRALRLCLGLLIIGQAINSRDWPIGLMGILFTLMPVFNIGCCSSGNCAIPHQKMAKQAELSSKEL